MTTAGSDAAVLVDDLADVRELVQEASSTEGLAPIGLREVVSGAGALAALPDLLARIEVPQGGVVAVLADDTPKAHGAESLAAVVHAVLTARCSVTSVVLAAAHGQEVHADPATVDGAVASVSSERAVALVSVGSGTVADIGKVVAQRLGLTHVVVQTAASVNGFADDQSVLLVNGTKRTTPSRWPDALVIDTTVLESSPLAMTRAGLGDLLSTFTGAADWQLATTVGFDSSYSPTAVAVLREGIEETMAEAAGLGRHEPSALQRLARSLTYGGLAMGAAGRTSPSSGAEHTISHLLEMSATALGRPSAYHGAQVGVASVVVARLWESMRAQLLAGDCVVRPLEPTVLRERVHDAFTHLDRTGSMARECWSAYERKLQWVNGNVAHLQRVCDEWATHDPGVGALLAGPDRLSQTLAAAGAPVRPAELDPAPARGTTRWAVRNCHLMRDRFTIVDLAEMTGCWTGEHVDAALAGGR